MNISAINAELAKIGYKAVKVRRPTVSDWIADQEAKVRAVTLKRQSAFWRTQQLRNLAIRRQISAEYEAFITRNGGDNGFSR